MIKNIIAHLRPISCHVWRLVKTELLVSESKAASLNSPQLCLGPAIIARNSHCSQLQQGRRRRGAEHWLAEISNRLTTIYVWSQLQTWPVPVESAIFLRLEWKIGAGQDVSLLDCSLFTSSWFNRSNGTLEEIPQSWNETQSKQRAPVRARAHKHFHTHCPTC